MTPARSHAMDNKVQHARRRSPGPSCRVGPKAAAVPQGCIAAPFVRLHAPLYSCRLRGGCLYRNPQNPVHVPPRWRLLEGKIPDREELSAKIQVGGDTKGLQPFSLGATALAVQPTALAPRLQYCP